MVKKHFSLTNCTVMLGLVCMMGCGGGKNTASVPVEAVPVYQETAGDYYLQPGDNLDIKFFYNPELNENVTIRPDGKISLQLIEEVQAAGLTPAQLDDLLTKQYATQLKQATLTVIIKEFGGQRIYVGGEVNSPQVLEVVGRVNALQAIFNAGGFKDNAKMSSVMIVSRGSENTPQVRKVDLKQALNGNLSENDYLLKPFDMVYVPKTNLARADEFMKHIYNFIPPRIGLNFQYELHSEDNNDNYKRDTNVE